jgi:hypothetical protein
LRSLFTDHDTITILLESQVILPTKLRNPVLGEKQEWYERFLIDNFSLTAKALAFTSLSTIRETLKQLFYKNTPLLKSALSSIAENRDYLWIEISRTSPHIVIDFLGEIRDYAVNPGIDSEIAKHLLGLHEHIIKRSVSLKSPYRAVLTRSSLSLGYVASFLKYLYPAHKNEHDELLSDLLLPSYSESLVLRGLSKPLDHFTNFLEHCRNVSEYNCETLLPYLKQRQQIDLFLMAFDSWQVDSSIFYMKFWESIASANCKEYVDILINELFSTTRKKAIYNKLLTSNIPQVLALYRFSQNDQQIQQCFPNDISSLVNLSKKLIKNSERIQLNQLIKTINDLSLTGSAGNLLAEYLRKLVGSDDEKILFRLFKTTDLRSTIAFLNRLRNNSSNDLFDFCLSGLRRKHYFENRLSAVLRPYQNAPIKIGRGKAGDRPTVHITQLLQFLTQNDMDYLHIILSNLRENRAAFVHALLSDHIDSVSSILSTIDSISSEETLFVDSLISEELSSEQSFETLAFNATQKGVGYLKAFLSYSQRRNLRLCLGVLSYLKGKYQPSFLNDCSISESGQFYALLKWLDKPHPSALITSCEILNSMDKQQRSNVVKSFFASTENNRKAMKEYLSSKHPDFYLAISGKEKI